MKTTSIAIALLCVPIAAQAGGSPKQCLQVAQLSPNPARGVQQAIDPLTLCHSQRARISTEIRSLRGQIAGAQQQLSGMSGLSFMCTDETTSRNSKGVSEDCWPNRCSPEGGRCIQDPRSSAYCAGGTVWDSSTGDCIVPPPPSND